MSDHGWLALKDAPVNTPVLVTVYNTETQSRSVRTYIFKDVSRGLFQGWCDPRVLGKPLEHEKVLRWRHIPPAYEGF